MAKFENIKVRVSLAWWFKYAVYALAAISLGGPMNERALDWVIKRATKVDTI